MRKGEGKREIQKEYVAEGSPNDLISVGLEQFITMLIAPNLCFDRNNLKKGLGNKHFFTVKG